MRYIYFCFISLLLSCSYSQKDITTSSIEKEVEYIPPYMISIRKIVKDYPNWAVNDIQHQKIEKKLSDSICNLFNKGEFDSSYYSVKGAKDMGNGTYVVHLTLEADPTFGVLKKCAPFRLIKGDILLLTKGDTSQYFLNDKYYTLNIGNVKKAEPDLLKYLTHNYIHAPYLFISGDSLLFLGNFTATLKTPISKPN